MQLSHFQRVLAASILGLIWFDFGLGVAAGGLVDRDVIDAIFDVTCRLILIFLRWLRRLSRLLLLLLLLDCLDLWLLSVHTTNLLA